MDSNVIVATILRNFSAREVAVTAERANQPPQWRWSPTVVLFPEGRCPFCNESIQSNRIWLVADEAKQLMGQVAVSGVQADGTCRLLHEPPLHPHVRGNGVCVGGASSTVSALFLGLNPGDAYRKDRNWWFAWLVSHWDHQCSKKPVLQPWVPNSERPNTLCGCGCRCRPRNGSCHCMCIACVCDNYLPAPEPVADVAAAVDEDSIDSIEFEDYDDPDDDDDDHDCHMDCCGSCVTCEERG